MKYSSRLPPPPQQIYDYLNGHIIGHYVMKKALSVAIYNHFCNISVDRPQQLSLALAHPTSESRCDDYHQASETGGVPDPEYLSPVINSVIIDASTHRLHLRKSNSLVFDATGHSRPLSVIVVSIAQCLNVPFITCDCSYLSPIHSSGKAAPGAPNRRQTDRTLARLLNGYCRETIHSIVANLYKKSEYDLNQAQRGIVLLDNLHNLGTNQGLGREERRQLLKEILHIIDGTRVDVTRADSSSSQGREVINTASIFFVCFGLFEAEEQLHCHRVSPRRLRLEDVAPREHEARDGSEARDREGQSAIKASGEVKAKLSSNLSSGYASAMSKYLSTSPSKKIVFSGATAKRKSSHDSDISASSSPEEQYNNHWQPQQQQKRCHRHGLDKDPVDGTANNGGDDDDDSFSGLEENKLARLLTEGEKSPIPLYKHLWGMKDIKLKFTPEALEIIADQAMAQHAGRDGVAIILEKLFLTVKFDILGRTNLIAVEITDDFVLGKTRPTYHYAPSRSQHPDLLHPIGEESSSGLAAAGGLTDYELSIQEQMEI